MDEMEQSMRIIEQAMAQIPGGPVLLDMDGQVIPAEDMVDDAKMGRIQKICGKMAEVDPTLGGSQKNIFSEVQTLNKHATMPPKEDTYGNIEGLMNHFKTVMAGHGIRPPKGEAYLPVEGAN